MAKYKLEDLEKKYERFAAPEARLVLNGKPVKDERWHIKSVESETTVDYASGVCVVVLTGLYDAEKSKFICEDDLILGTPVSIETGYIVTSPVFFGYLYAVEYTLGTETESSVTLTCMDVKAAMMGAGLVGFSGNATHKQLIEGFFSGETARGYTELCKAPDMSALPELERPVSFQTARMDDYTFLTETARRFGLECFVDGGKLVLRKESDSKTPLIALSGLGYIRDISSVNTSLGYVGQITVYGGSDDERDGEKKRAKSIAKNSFEISPKNSSAGRLIGGREAQFFSASVRDEKSAKELAQAQMRLRQRVASEITITMQGIPEIAPGYYMKLEGISPKINGDLYITAVRHIMDESGYRTTVIARREN